MTKNLILWLIVAIIGLGLITFANTFRYTQPSGNLSVLTQTPSSSFEPTDQTTPIPTPKPGSSVSFPAACQLSGEIVFINKNLYETKDAKIAYQNVDDKIRQIFWKSNPDDGVLVIGPNLFQELPLPNGQREIGVVLEKTPIAKSYLLTATITYGVRNSNGAEEVKNAACTGKITVTMP